MKWKKRVASTPQFHGDTHKKEMEGLEEKIYNIMQREEHQPQF